ncbi:uncharacterized protein N7496_001749 [Penicillium cataractarum]|uniref:Adipose-regulatory protein-domain-containing protein n=1 Tax=Penicillium cataractarum TaxID=2100454 RepID=A0A9X0B789_9EURO|nr:uncharacterized protein N7496_001749 [Penicillium cataractarum]KAJ5390681.1 hypothetical protein N7496_001749 [Penicillium cataractarum]
MADSEYTDDETEYGGPSHSQAVVMVSLVLSSDLNPWGTASLGSEFVSSQPYDVSVALDLPRTPSNLDVGNFMIDLTLYAPETASVLPTTANSQNKISHSRRPAILTYTSPLVDVARRLVRLPLYVVGWRREAETLEVSMMEKVEFARGSRNRPQSLRLEIQSGRKMQIYSARVEFRARFTGLRSIFWTVSMASASLTWFLLTWIMQSDKPKGEIKEEGEEEEEFSAAIKEELEDSGSSSEPVKVKKEESETSLLQSYPAEGESAGLGSGRESAEARGVQKRRSHSTEGDH